MYTIVDILMQALGDALKYMKYLLTCQRPSTMFWRFVELGKAFDNLDFGAAADYFFLESSVFLRILF